MARMLAAAVPAPLMAHPDDPFRAASVIVTCDRLRLPLSVPSKTIGATAGDVDTVTGPESWVPFCESVHVTRSARPPPDPCPRLPDHVPARMRSVVGPVAELHAPASAASIATMAPRTALRFMSLRPYFSAGLANSAGSIFTLCSMVLTETKNVCTADEPLKLNGSFTPSTSR